MNKIDQKYYEYLKYELNYSDNTIKDYLRNLESFFSYLDTLKKDYLSLTKEDTINYLKYLDKKKLSNKTIANILSSIRTYYDYLLDLKKVDINIFKLVKNPKIEKKLPSFLSEGEMDDIFDSIECNNVLDYRNKLIIELFYDTGIRVSELTNIKLEDIKKAEKTIRIYGKGNKERIVYYTKKCAEAIDNYLNVRNSDSEFLILNFKGDKITSRGIEKIISNIFTKAAIKTKASPHTIRHTFATHLLNNGADIKSVQELLGHSSLNTTEIYTHVTSEYLKQEYLKNMPRK